MDTCHSPLADLMDTNIQPMSSSDVVAKDHRLTHFLQKYLYAVPRYNNDPTLKGIKMCGSRTIPCLLNDQIFVAANDEASKFVGLTHCGSPWACPRCAPDVMARKGARIAVALDALAHENIYAFMVTFTIPHNSSLSCKESLELLKKTWRDFTRSQKVKKQYTLKLDVNEVNHKGGHAVGKKGQVQTYNLKKTPFTEFRHLCEIEHFVRVYEVTWSEKNGWHPHLHVLFWVPEKHLSNVTKFEDKLLDFWWLTARNKYAKFIQKECDCRPDIAKRIANNYYTDWRKYPKTGHRAVYFSKDKSGKVIIQRSSFYISGWSGNMELTYQLKEARSEGHFAPLQLLQLAYDNWSKNFSYAKKLLDLYIEYVKATRYNRRVHFSQSGLNKIIDTWKLSNEYIEVTKKNFMAKKPLHVVCYFNAEEWSQIYSAEIVLKEDIRSQILELARAPTRLPLERFLLEKVNIDISKQNLDSWIVKRVNLLFSA